MLPVSEDHAIRGDTPKLKSTASHPVGAEQHQDLAEMFICKVEGECDRDSNPPIRSLKDGPLVDLSTELKDWMDEIVELVRVRLGYYG